VIRPKASVDTPELVSRSAASKELLTVVGVVLVLHVPSVAAGNTELDVRFPFNPADPANPYVRVVQPAPSTARAGSLERELFAH